MLRRTHPAQASRFNDANMTRRTIALAGAATVLVAGLALGAAPLDDLYVPVFGPPILDEVDFATLTRRSSPNDALICPPDLCLKARIDIVPPVYPVSAQRLRAIVAEVAEGEPRTLPASGNALSDDSDQDRYGARSRIFHFPDTIDVKIIPRGEASATLALYSRSQIGYWDFGVNRARLERWLKRIGEIAAETPDVTEG
jgi:uncharacterized protein (DUF1499 family)